MNTEQCVDTTTFGAYSLQDAIDGLFAYDMGGPDTGIKDENLRKEVVKYIDSLPEDESRLILSRILRELYLTDGALSQGYGWEDALEFGKWLDEGAYRGQ